MNFQERPDAPGFGRLLSGSWSGSFELTPVLLRTWKGKEGRQWTEQRAGITPMSGDGM